MKQVVALIEASPTYLSRRMKLIESRLAGKQRMVLSTSPSAQADRWRSWAHVGEVRLWKLPYETALSETRLNTDEIRQRMLLILPFQAGRAGELGKARLLHFKGMLSGDEGATHYYQTLGRRMWKSRQPSFVLWIGIFRFRAKQNASYWLGLVCFERDKYAEAIDYFPTRTMRAWPDGFRMPGANYNLGRAYEASGRTSEAIAQYRREKRRATKGIRRGPPGWKSTPADINAECGVRACTHAIGGKSGYVGASTHPTTTARTLTPLRLLLGGEAEFDESRDVLLDVQAAHPACRCPSSWYRSSHRSNPCPGVWPGQDDFGQKSCRVACLRLPPWRC